MNDAVQGSVVSSVVCVDITVSLPKAHTDEVFSVDYSPDSKTLATCGADRTIKVWDAHSGICERTLTGHRARINAVAFSPDGLSLVSASGDFTSEETDNSVVVWTCSDWSEKMRTSALDVFYAVDWSPDSKLVASGSRDSTIRIWNLENDTQTQLNGHRAVVYSVAFSPDGGLLASGGGDKTLFLWEVPSGRVIRGPIEGHTHWVSSVVWNMSGTLIISASWDSTIR